MYVHMYVRMNIFVWDSGFHSLADRRRRTRAHKCTRLGLWLRLECLVLVFPMLPWTCDVGS